MDARAFLYRIFIFKLTYVSDGSIFFRSLKTNAYKNYINRKLFSGGMFSIIALKFVEVFRIIITKMLHLVRVVTFTKAR